MCGLVSPNGLHILEVLIYKMETKCFSHTAFSPPNQEVNNNNKSKWNSIYT